MTKNEHFFKESEIPPKVAAPKHYVERRKYPRFKPCSKIYMLHPIFGSVTDISVSGLACTYFSWKDDSQETSPVKGSIFSVLEHYLDDMPLVVVADDVVQSSAKPILTEVKKRRMRFSGLTEEQLEELELFLLANVEVPELAGEEQRKYRKIAAGGNFSS